MHFYGDISLLYLNFQVSMVSIHLNILFFHIHSLFFPTVSFAPCSTRSDWCVLMWGNWLSMIGQKAVGRAAVMWCHCWLSLIGRVLQQAPSFRADEGSVDDIQGIEWSICCLLVNRCCPFLARYPSSAGHIGPQPYQHRQWSWGRDRHWAFMSCGADSIGAL